MKRALVVPMIVLALFAGASTARAHVGSFDVFYEGDAGPYHVFVTVRVPQVIPGVATIEVRARDSTVTGMTVVPMRLTGPGSELPPAPDRAVRSSADPQFFTAELWLMEFGSMQVQVSVEGAQGPGVVSVPIPAVAQRTLSMDRTLGTVLFALMTLLALSLISILASAVREAGLPPGEEPKRNTRRGLIAMAVITALVVGVIGFGKRWWDAEAADYERVIARPWKFGATQSGCELRIPDIGESLMKDHGHDIHLFVARAPALDRLAHLHPERQGDGTYLQRLPSLPAGTYVLFADIVLPSGFPITGTSTLTIPDLQCPALVGDDSVWNGEPSTLAMDPPVARVGVAQSLRFQIRNDDGTPATDVHPYMGMAGHAAVVRKDLSVFAHLHPNGSIAMPALMLARSPHEMSSASATLSPEVSFPYGFPRAGDYRVFVQVKRGERIETGSFDLTVTP